MPKKNDPSYIKNKINSAIKLLEKRKLTEKDSVIKLLKEISESQITPLLQNEAFFRTTLYSIGDAVITTDLNGKIMQINPSAEKLTGWKEAEAKNKPLNKVFNIINEMTGKKIESSCQAVIRSCKKIDLPGHILLIAKSGKRIPITDSCAPIIDDNNKVVGVVLVFRDQTEERVKQTELEEREQKYSNLISNLPGFTYRCLADKNWTMIYLSDGFKKITGYLPKDFINNKKLTYNDIIHKDYQEIIWKEWQKVFKNKTHFEYEYPIITKNGKQIWIWERGNGVYSKEGKLLFLEGFIENINEKKLAQEALTLKNTAFQSAISANSVADLNGNIIDLNSAFLDLWKYPKTNEVIGKPIKTFLKNENEYLDIINTLDKVGFWHGNYTAKRKDGTEFIAHGIATRMLSDKGKIIGYQASVIDITDQKKTEELLKEIEIRYKSFFDNSPDAIFLIDPETSKIIDANKEALELLKLPYKKVIKMNQSQLHPNRLKDYSEKTFYEQIEYIKLKIPVENFLLTAKGEEIPVEILASTLTLNGKKVIQQVFRNISDRRRIEKALQESEDKFRLFFEYSKDPMLLLDKEIFFECNQAAMDLLGYTSKEELLSYPPYELSPEFQPDGNLSIEKARKLIDQAYKEGLARFEWVHKKRNGENVFVEVMLTLIPISGKEFLFTIWRDITERKMLELENQKNKERMQLLVEGTPQLFFYVQNTNGEMQYVSPSVEEITGRSVEQWLKHKRWFTTDSFVNVTARERTKIHLEGKIITDPIYVELLHPNGSKISLEVYERPVFSDGKVVGLQGVAHDITQRMQAEEKLIESEINYTKLFNSVSDAIQILDKDGVFIDCNNGTLKMFGYDYEELVGKTPEFITATDLNDFADVKEHLIKTFSGEIKQFEIWSQRKNGEVFLQEIRLYPGSYTGIDVIIAIGKDITKQKKAEELLRESEKRYRLIADNTADSIAVFDLNLNYTYLSPSVSNLLGYSPEELMSLGLQKILSPKDFENAREMFRKGFEEAMTDKAYTDRTLLLEIEQIRKDGKKIWVESKMSYIMDENEMPVGLLGVTRDITERKRFEAELAFGEEKYRTISNLTSDYIFSTKLDSDDNHQIDWVAGSFEKITGYTFEEYKKIGGWRATLHPEDLEHDNQDLEKLKKNEKVSSEVKTYHKNGSIVWVRSYAQPVWDVENDRLRGIYGAVEDITKRKQTEILQMIQYKIANAVVSFQSITDLFALTREELSSIMDVSNFFIALYDESSGMFNPDIIKGKMKDYSGWIAKGSMSGYVIEQKKSLLLTKDQINELSKSGVAGMIGIIPEIWLGVPLLISGKAIGILVVQSYDNPNAYDQSSVTILEIVAHELSIYIRHKQAEEETLKLTTAITQSPTIVMITDPSNKIEYVNPKFTEVTGYTFEEVKGKDPELLRTYHHKKEFYDDIRNTLNAGKIWYGEILNKKKNGELYWENNIISSIFNDEGVLTHYVALKEDVTEKKKMIEELIIAKEKAEEMNRVKSSFFANMSHELRTPMVGILGFSEFLMNEFEGNPDYYNMVKSINVSGQRLLETLNHILNISKLEASKVEVNLEILNIVPLLQESFGFFKSVALKKNLEYSFKNNYPEIICKIDQQLFTSIINNLLNNAIKFTDFGEVVLSTSIDNNDVIITVSDTGVGISEKKQDLIWEEFRQASEGYNRGFEGTGLGLTIAKKYTDLINGSISVESSLGKGTVFTLRLPISKSSPEQKEIKVNIEVHPINESKTPNPMIKILYVEDDEIAVKYVTTITKAYYSVDAATDSDEALNKLKRTKYDAILMDINLRRGMDGIELTKVIRKIAGYDSIPIIAITAFAMGKEKEEFLQQGITHYLSKPFVKAQLLDLLNEIIDKN